METTTAEGWCPGCGVRARLHLDLVTGELLVSAVGQGAAIEDITAILLLTGEDHFNALAAATVAGYSDRPVYRVAPSPDAVATNIPGDTLFAPALTRENVSTRHNSGARITT